MPLSGLVDSGLRSAIVFVVRIFSRLPAGEDPSPIDAQPVVIAAGTGSSLRMAASIGPNPHSVKRAR